MPAWMSEKPHVEIRKNFSCDLIKMLIPYIKFISKIAMVKGFFKWCLCCFFVFCKNQLTQKLLWGRDPETVKGWIPFSKSKTLSCSKFISLRHDACTSRSNKKGTSQWILSIFITFRMVPVKSPCTESSSSLLVYLVSCCRRVT